MNKRGFIKSIVLLTSAASVGPQIFIPKFGPINWVSHRRNARYLYIKSRFKLLSDNYSFPWSVTAIDTSDKCGFTPQDWNHGWTPDNDYREITFSDFKKRCKNLKTVTTHFINPNWDWAAKYQYYYE